jgi:hypothetical protein
MDGERSLIQHALVVHRIDLERWVARFYSLMIEPDLFRRVCPIDCAYFGNRSWTWALTCQSAPPVGLATL